MASLKALLSGESRHSSSPEPPPDDPEERRKLNQGPPDTSVGSKDEADTTHPYPFPSPQSSCCSLSVPGSVASSFFSNERDGESSGKGNKPCMIGYVNFLAVLL